MSQAISNSLPVFEPLIAARRSCRICLDHSPGKIHNGSSRPFDPSVVSYWSQWLGHPAPKLLIVGQDFSDIDYFDRHHGADVAKNPTNEKLRELLTSCTALRPTLPPVHDPNTPIYLTNAILCLKNPPMNSPILNSWVTNCTKLHLHPLIEKLAPPVIVAMGAKAWHAVRVASNLDSAPTALKDAVGKEWVDKDYRRIFPVGHCGRLGLRNRPAFLQEQDWMRIGAALKDYL